MENPQWVPTVHVVATSVEGTEAALRAAAPVATRQQARLVLLVPDIGSPETDDSPIATNWLIARYEETARTIEHPVVIRLCKTPNAAEAALRLTPGRAVMFVGGTSNWLWPSVEERLAARLRRSGRDVVFVACNSGSTKTKVQQGVNVHA